MQLHLFSTPGEPLLHDVVQACRTIVGAHRARVVAYLPAAAMGPLWMDYTVEAFRDVAGVRLIVSGLVNKWPPSSGWVSWLVWRWVVILLLFGALARMSERKLQEPEAEK